ncbi:37063_t:CDS:1, partial [Gigaspora margarita]
SFVLLIVVKWYLRDYERVRNEEAAGSIGREIVVVEKQIEPPKPAVISDIIG